MKLIFLYGPPASGKLTVAEELSKRTGIAVFHNHLTRDIVKDIYGDTLRDNYELVDRIRVEVMEYCAKHETNLIFTYVYEGSDDDDNVRLFINAVEENGGEVVFAELTANRQDLIDRVGNESRKRFKKLTDPEVMKKITEDMTTYSIPFVESLKVDTSSLSPIESANLIADTFSL